VTRTNTHCTHCRAQITAEDTRYCPYCGTVLPRTAAAVPMTVPERFAALERHPDLPGLLQLRPSTAGQWTSHTLSVVFSGLFVVVAFVALKAFSGAGNGIGGLGGSLFSVIPLVIIGVGAIALVRSLTKVARFASSPMIQSLARVADERTQVTGGGESSSARTSYFVTVETETGDRREYSISGRLAGQLAPDDMGVAYTRGGTLVEFRPLRV